MKPLHDLFAFSLVAISLLGSLPTHASPIVGGWYGTHLGQADSTAVITFLADGSYWMAEDGSSVLDPSGQDGMEKGSFTWNPLTDAFSSTTLVDTSGEWGLSHSNIASAAVSCNTLQLSDGSDTFSLLRVVSDPQVCAIPEPQTWANLLLGLGLMAAFVRRRSSSRNGVR